MQRAVCRLNDRCTASNLSSNTCCLKHFFYNFLFAPAFIATLQCNRRLSWNAACKEAF